MGIISSILNENNKINKTVTYGKNINETQLTKNMKQVKFELLVDDINKALTSEESEFELLFEGTEVPLNLIFYNIENLYAKIILKKIVFYVPEWSNKYTVKSLSNTDVLIKAINEFIQEYRKTENRQQTLVFAFWTLFTLSVVH